MKKLMLVGTMLAGALLLPSSALAQDSTRQVSVTVSPLHLVMPVLELTGELQVAPQVGAALIVGVGSVAVLGDSATVYEVGAQGRYYLLGDFDSGLHLGLEALYVGVSVDQESVTATGSGLSVGGFGGYKHTFELGLVLEGQLGYAQTLIGATASNGSASASESDVSGGVLLNLNIGWAF